MIASVAVTIGKPFRRSCFLGRKHMGLLLIHSGWICYLCFSEQSGFSEMIDNKRMTDGFGGILIGLILANGLVSGVVTTLADYFF